MARRRPRFKGVERLVSPVAQRIRRRVPRIARRFPPVPPRWSFARKRLSRLPSTHGRAA
jgi:hypothetical protein